MMAVDYPYFIGGDCEMKGYKRDDSVIGEITLSRFSERYSKMISGDFLEFFTSRFCDGSDFYVHICILTHVQFG